MLTRLSPGRAIPLVAAIIVSALAIYLGWTSLTAPDIASDVRSLREAGATVTEQTPSDGSGFLHGSAHHLLVNGQDVWVYEYAAPALAEIDASGISATARHIAQALGRLARWSLWIMLRRHTTTRRAA